MSEEKAIYRLNFHKENADLENGTVIVNKIDLETVLQLLKEKDNKINKYEEMILNINQKSIETKNIVNIIKNKICELWIKCPKNAINGFMIVERKHKIEILSEILKEL